MSKTSNTQATQQTPDTQDLEQSNTQESQEAQNTQKNPWYADLSTPELRGYVGNKGWQNPEDLALAYKNLESHVGGDKLPVPEQGQLHEWFKQNAQHLNVPEKAEDYTIPEIDLPEGINTDEEFIKKARQFAYDKGVPAPLFEAFYELYTNHVIEAHTHMQTMATQDKQHMQEALGKEWGKDYKKNMDIAHAAMRVANLNDEEQQVMTQALGNPIIAKVFYEFGKTLNEDTLHTHMNPQQSAKLELEKLRQDPKFMEAFKNGDPMAIEKHQNAIMAMNPNA